MTLDAKDLNLLQELRRVEAELKSGLEGLQDAWPGAFFLLKGVW